MKGRILLVEDSPTQAQHARVILEAEGYAVDHVSDGVAALEAFGRGLPDAVISDIVMPGMDGYELCRRIRQDEVTRPLPVVLLTSLSDPTDIIRGLECGADNFLIKPVDPDEFRSRLERLLLLRRVSEPRRWKVGIEMMVLGQKVTINSEKEQILDLLISTFEEYLRTRRHQETLTQSLQFLRRAMDALPDSTAVLDPAGRIRIVNRRWSRMEPGHPFVGGDLQEGMSYIDACGEKYGSAIRDVADGKTTEYRDEYACLVAGRPRWYSLQIQPLGSPADRHVLLVHRDVTDERLAGFRRALRADVVERLEHASTPDEGLGDAIRAVAETLRWDAAEFWESRGDALVRSAVWAATESARRFVTGPPDARPAERVMRSGKPVWVRDVASDRSFGRAEEAVACGLCTALAVPLGDSKGPRGVLLLARSLQLEADPDVIALLEDVGTLLSAVLTRRRAQAELAQAQRLQAVGRLAGGVAHDFNNMLTVVRGYAELLLRQARGDVKWSEPLLEIRKAAERAEALTRQLLAFSRRQPVQPREVDLNQALNEMGSMLRSALRENVRLHLRPAPRLPPVRLDPAQFEQAVMNLVINARDAMPGGGNVTIETACGADLVRVVVRDDGEGMDEEVRSHVFEPFFTTKPKDKGSGLGLATVYGFVHQSGGRLQVESEKGKGSSFILEFPPASPEAPVELPAADRPTSRGRLLAVEDEPALRALLARILIDGGYEVVAAVDADEAERAFADAGGAFDLLVTDVVMPGRGGPQLAEALRRSRAGLRVLFMSGYSADEAALKRPGPGSAFLPKPFTPEQVLEAVRKLLEG